MVVSLGAAGRTVTAADSWDRKLEDARGSWATLLPSP